MDFNYGDFLGQREKRISDVLISRGDFVPKNKREMFFPISYPRHSSTKKKIYYLFTDITIVCIKPLLNTLDKKTITRNVILFLSKGGGSTLIKNKSKSNIEY